MKYLFIGLVALFCSAQCNSKKGDEMKQLEHLLFSETFSSLFFNATNNTDSLWNRFGQEAHLDVVKNSSKNHSRLLASEILYAKLPDYPNDSLVPTLCEIYSEAIKESSPLVKETLIPANAWGFMHEDDDIGYLGNRLLLLGDPIIPYLVKLSNVNAPILYLGSEDATIGSMYNYRVKDVAAFYIAKIKGIPIEFYQAFEERDKQIERLIALLEKQ